MTHYDVLVIGGGAAGLSAALVLSRARRSVVVVDAGEPRNAPAQHLHGFLSRDGMRPGELLAVGRREVEGYGGEIRPGRVRELRRTASAYDALLDDGCTLTARGVVVATGLRDELPDLPGVAERWGRDLLHCPYCHGYEVRDRPLAVLGGTPEAVQHAQLVRQWSDDVVLLPHGDVLSADAREQLVARGIGVVDGRVARVVVTADRLTGMALADGRVIPREAAFVRPRFVPRTELLVGLGCAVGVDGWVATDAAGRTGLPEVFVAGNAADPRAQLVTAAGAGSAAAIALNADLVEQDVRDALRGFRLGLPLPPTPVR